MPGWKWQSPLKAPHMPIHCTEKAPTPRTPGLEETQREYPGPGALRPHQGRGIECGMNFVHPV